MHSIPINWLAVLVATLTKFVLGWIWFGPVFGKPWRKMVGLKRKQAKAMMGKAIVYDLGTTFLMSLALAHVVHLAGATSPFQGAAVGFFSWLGFIGSTTFAATLYEQRPFKFWVLTNAYTALSLSIMGAILAVWV